MSIVSFLVQIDSGILCLQMFFFDLGSEMTLFLGLVGTAHLLALSS